MIRAIIRFFFAREIAAYVAEARKILDDTKAQAKREYITFERYEVGSPAFLHALQPVYGNKAVISWLKDRQEKIYQVIKLGDAAALQNFVGRALAIDAMFKDLEDFEAAYKQMLEDAAEAKKVVAHG